MRENDTVALLINSPLFRESLTAADEDYLPSLGLGMLARAARAAGIQVEYVDAIFERRGVGDLVQLIERSSCRTVGLNIFTVNQHLIREIVERVRRPVRFVLGGLSTRALLSLITKWNIRRPLHVVFGDGENIFPLLARKPELVDASATYGNVSYYEVNHRSHYYSKDISGVYSARDIFKNEPYVNVHGVREACIVTSRGCIYNCAFCAAAKSVNSGMTAREASAESVRTELAAIAGSGEVQSIRVLDDLYLKNRDSIRRASQTFARSDLGWRAMAHVASIRQVPDEDLVDLRESGCTELFIGIESGSPELLRRIHKTSNTELIKQQIARLFAAGIDVKAYFIFGFPKETEDDMGLTLRLVNDINKDAVRLGGGFRTSVFQFRPYHGTELYHASHAQSAQPKESDARFDDELTRRVGRPQYNFESGNYSSVSTSTLRDHIADAARVSTSHRRPTAIDHQRTH